MLVEIRLCSFSVTKLFSKFDWRMWLLYKIDSSSSRRVSFDWRGSVTYGIVILLVGVVGYCFLDWWTDGLDSIGGFNVLF